MGSKHGMGSAKREREGDSDQQAVVFHPEKRTKGLMERECSGDDVAACAGMIHFQRPPLRRRLPLWETDADAADGCAVGAK